VSADSPSGQVAIVTGASSGIGLGITRALLEHGYRVVANSRNISKSKEPNASANLVLVDGDIGKKETAIQVADAAVKNFGRIDLLVTDVGLPKGMNGRQLADAARTSRPELRVLFITGYAENAVVGDGRLDPGMHVLTKPFTLESLAARIRDLVSN